MSLQLRARKRNINNWILTVASVFAFVVSPFYGVIESRAANAVGGSNDITYNFNDYNGGNSWGSDWSFSGTDAYKNPNDCGTAKNCVKFNHNGDSATLTLPAGQTASAISFYLKQHDNGNTTSYLELTEYDGNTQLFDTTFTDSYSNAALKPGTNKLVFTMLKVQSGSNIAFDDVVVTTVATPSNHAPIASDGTLITDENQTKNGQLQASDADGDTLVYNKVTGPSHGVLSVNSDGSYVYTPAANFTGADSFTFNANDGTADSNTATVNITVNSITPVQTPNSVSLVSSTTDSVTLNFNITNDNTGGSGACFDIDADADTTLPSNIKYPAWEYGSICLPVGWNDNITIDNVHSWIKVRENLLTGNTDWQTFNVLPGDTAGPTITVKPSSSYTVGSVSGNTFSKASFSFYDSGKVVKYDINGTVTNVSPNKYSDANYITVGHHGAVYGQNTLTAYDTAGNTSTYSFVLDNIKPSISVKSSSVGSVTDNVFSKADFKLHDQYKVSRYQVNGGTWHDVTPNTYSDANGISVGHNGGVYGSNTIALEDLAGNQATYDFNLDNVAPTITPQDYVGNINQAVFSKVSFGFYDHYKIDKYSINGNEIDLGNAVWSNANFQNFASYLHYGENSLVLYDEAGNTAAYDFVYDNVEPTITVKDGYVGNQPKAVFSQVSFSLYDKYQVDKYVINGHVVDFTNNKWSDANFQNIQQYLHNGKNTLELYDIAGNHSSYDFTFDSTAPKIYVKQTGTAYTSPTSVGSFTEKVFSQISFKLNDNNAVDYVKVNGWVLQLSDNTWSDANFDAIKGHLHQGAGNVVTVFDVAGNSTDYEFTFDSVAPTFGLTDDGNPRIPIADGSVINPSKLGDIDHNGNTIRFTKESATDTLYVNGLPIFGHGYFNNGKSGQIGAAFVNDGTYTLYTEDIAGNRSATITFTVDSTAPAAPSGLNWLDSNSNPATNGFTNVQKGTLSWQDSDPSVDHYVYKFWTNIPGYHDGEANAWTTDDSNYFTPAVDGGSIWTNFDDKEGTYSFCVKAVDAVGNTSACSATYTVTYDHTAPGAPTLVSPSNPSVLNGSSITQIWAAPSGSADIAYYIYESYNDAAGTSLRWSQEFTGTSKTAANVGEATYWWGVRAVDKAGNVGQMSPLWKITVDNTAPVLTVNTYSGTNTTPTITGTTNSSDDVVTVDGNPVTTFSTTPNTNGTYDWTYVPTTPFALGTTTLPIVSTDTAGNYTQDATTVTVSEPDNNNPGTDTNTGDNTNTGDAVVAVTPAGTQTTGQTPNQAVLGASDNNADGTTDNSATDKAVKGADKTVAAVSNGLAWYYWIIIVLAALALLWWIIAAARRRKNEE